MLESITDMFCLAILVLFPIVVLWQMFMHFLNHRKTRKREEIGKYYREW